MSRFKSIIVLLTLCALASSAVTAANASAAQRAYTCTKSATPKDHSDAHCVIVGPGEYGHTLIVGATSVSGTNAKTASATAAATVQKLKGALSGVVTEIQCTGSSGSGSLTNAAESVSSTGVIEFSGCSVTAPAGKGCVVTGGKITTKELASTTVGQAAGKLKVSPASGTEFATVSISSCSIAALNNSFPITGSFVASISGATITTTHEGITTQNTLKFGGVKAGIEGATTTSMTLGDPITYT